MFFILRKYNLETLRYCQVNFDKLGWGRETQQRQTVCSLLWFGISDACKAIIDNLQLWTLHNLSWQYLKLWVYNAMMCTFGFEGYKYVLIFRKWNKNVCTFFHTVKNAAQIFDGLSTISKKGGLPVLAVFKSHYFLIQHMCQGRQAG